MHTETFTATGIATMDNQRRMMILRRVRALYDADIALGYPPRYALYRAWKRGGTTGLRTVRISSAKARGKAKRFAYWGVAHYRIVCGRYGLVARVIHGATSERRSHRLCVRDAQKTARPIMQRLGYLDDHACVALADALV